MKSRITDHHSATSAVSRAIVVAMALLMVAVVAVGCETADDRAQAAPRISVEDAWAREAMADGGSTMAGQHGAASPEAHAPAGATSAIYLTIRNDGGEADSLVSAGTAVATKAELHESRIEGGVARMQPVDAIEIPAGDAVELRPGGLHIMLIGLTQDLDVGDTFEVELTFSRSGVLTVPVSVRTP